MQKRSNRSPASGNNSINNNNSGVIFIEPITTSANGSNNNKMSSSSSSAANGSSSAAATNGSSSSSSASDTAAAAAKMSSFKLLLLALMVLQNSSTVLVGRYSRSNSSLKTEDLYVVNHLLVVIEMGKLTLSLLLEFWSTSWSIKKTWSSVYLHCFQNPMDALKIMVPALLYLIQNTLLYVALGNLTAPIFQVTYQGKLVTTALVSVVMLQRSYTIQQWICLFGLSMGVATVVLGEKSASSGSNSDSSKSSGGGNLFIGLVAVTISCFSSALAGVYFEMVLKRNNTPSSGANATAAAQPSLWIRNVQLAFFSVLIALCQGWYDEFKMGRLFTSSSTEQQQSYLHGFTFWVWVLVALQAGGGLLVAAVIKYADNVLKGLATGVSVVLSSTLSMILFKTPLGMLFCMGATVILISVWYFSEPCPYIVQQFCIQKCKINLNTSWGHKSSTSSSSSTSSNGSDDTKSLLPK